MKLEFSKQSFKKYSNIKFNENPFSDSRVVPYGRTGRQTETDMTKLVVACCNFANAPKTDLKDLGFEYVNCNELDQGRVQQEMFIVILCGFQES
jgi:hypothetical protein